MKVEMTFLGTGTSTGVPVIGCQCPACTSQDPRDHRLRTSAMLKIDGATTLLIDAGPDFRQQMLRSGTNHIDAILLTHMHYDHVGGLDDVRGLNFTMRSGIDIYAQKATANAVRHNLFYVFSDHPYPGVPNITLNEITTETFHINKVAITPLPVMHDQLPIIGFRIGPVAYITDASLVPDSTIDLCEGVSLLAINALGLIPHHSHMNLEQAIEAAQKIGAKETYFTHIGHTMPLYSQIETHLPESMHLAFDGLCVETEG